MANVRFKILGAFEGGGEQSPGRRRNRNNSFTASRYYASSILVSVQFRTTRNRWLFQFGWSFGRRGSRAAVAGTPGVQFSANASKNFTPALEWRTNQR